MHELPVTRSICEIVLRHAAQNEATRVLAVILEIGALSDLQPEWLQRYFDHLCRDTVAEGAKLDVDHVPAVFRCKACLHSFEVSSILNDGLACAECRSPDVVIVSGRQYLVKAIEVI